MEALENHMQASGHTTKVGKANYSCQYCAKQYQSGANLFSHIRMQHRVEAKRDGIVNIDEVGEEAADEADDDGECEKNFSTANAKVTILILQTLSIQNNQFVKKTNTSPLR